jgi:uncharacterized repeat protein (TIGR03803 family)
LVALIVAPANAQNWNFVTLHHLTGSDPRPPYRGPILDRSGNLYFTTYGGGTLGEGAALRLAPDGTLTVLHSFGGSGDGSYPVAGLTPDRDGNFFGTTSFGGSAGEGTVFKLAPNGTETVRYSFKGGADGQQLGTGVVKVGRNLYGTATYGGAEDCQIATHQCGIVFKIEPDGTEEILHAFVGGDDGAVPHAGLIADAAGNLYGTTYYGGGGAGQCDGHTGNPDLGCGIAFMVAPDGTYTILHVFQGYPTDGANPEGDLLVDDGGNLYGSTNSGGANTNCAQYGCGTIFRLTSGATETILYNFAYDVAWSGRLVRDRSGDLFGTTVHEVFELKSDGSLNTLYYWYDNKNFPNPDLATDGSRNLFGTTQSLGRHPHGSVFELKRQ